MVALLLRHSLDLTYPCTFVYNMIMAEHGRTVTISITFWACFTPVNLYIIMEEHDCTVTNTQITVKYV